MDVIASIAKSFIDEHYVGGITTVEDVKRKARYVISDIDNVMDKVRFLNFVLEKNSQDYAQHLKVCKNPADCRLNRAYEGVSYFLLQELHRLGVNIDRDSFTDTEKAQAESRLDDIIRELNEVKLGQQILFEELNEMRDLFFLGKKKWYQLVIGKSFEMAASGVVSETVSKKIIEEAKRHLPNLLGQ
jgi:hypothetical protein